MKKIIVSLLFVFMGILGSNATVLFPRYVDIAPEYRKGITPELMAAGVECAIYSSTTGSYYPATFTDAESFFNDTMPGDVSKEERLVGNYRLLIYTSVERPNDTIETNDLWSRIYVLEMPGNKYQSAYCEQEVEKGGNNPF